MSKCYIPVVPRWDRLLDDLDTRDFQKRSEDFALSLVPKDLVYPQRDEIWEAVRDFDAHRTLDFTLVRVHCGQRVRICSSEPRPFSCVLVSLIAPDPCELMLSFHREPTCPPGREVYFSEAFRRVGSAD